jgi:hypothetical protein
MYRSMTRVLLANFIQNRIYGSPYCYNFNSAKPEETLYFAL